MKKPLEFDFDQIKKDANFGQVLAYYKQQTQFKKAIDKNGKEVVGEFIGFNPFRDPNKGVGSDKLFKIYYDAKTWNTLDKDIRKWDFDEKNNPKNISGGNVLQFVQRMESLNSTKLISILEAAKILDAITKSFQSPQAMDKYIAEKKVAEKTEKSAELKTSNQTFEERGLKPFVFDHSHEEVLALGFDTETAKRLQIGTISSKGNKDKVAIAVNNPQDKLVGYVFFEEDGSLSHHKNLDITVELWNREGAEGENVHIFFDLLEALQFAAENEAAHIYSFYKKEWNDTVTKILAGIPATENETVFVYYNNDIANQDWIKNVAWFLLQWGFLVSLAE